MQNLSAVSSRVRLARNYPDLPFDVSAQPEMAEMLISRTVNAISASEMHDRFVFHALCEMSEAQRKFLEESHLISKDLLKNQETSALLLDEGQQLSIMMQEDDHLRIQAIREGDQLQAAADCVFSVDDALSRQVNFAFDNAFGYLTAWPTDTGTGMRATMQLHLPLLTYFKQMGSVGQILARVGLNIRGVYGEGQEALGSLYQVGNQATLGRSEQETIRIILSVCGQIAEMEEALRARIMDEQKDYAEDKVYRAWGILSGARIMTLKEFYPLWSTLRTGMLLGMIRPDLGMINHLLEEVQDEHVAAYMEHKAEKDAINTMRATRIREALREAGTTAL